MRESCLLQRLQTSWWSPSFRGAFSEALCTGERARHERRVNLEWTQRVGVLIRVLPLAFAFPLLSLALATARSPGSGALVATEPPAAKSHGQRVVHFDALRRRLATVESTSRSASGSTSGSETPMIVSALADIDLLVGIALDFSQEVSALATPGLIKVLSEIVAPLSSCLTSSELAPIEDARIPVDAYRSVVEDGFVQEVHGLIRLLVRDEFHKAETARTLLEAVQTHDYPFYVATFGK
mmetsp:Transcript_29209/g.77162  ORF Transcript_29209/g.77162 Transcript_29209/m.77162 type:complete len:239 (+) Transcript_29209:157-873(+)